MDQKSMLLVVLIAALLVTVGLQTVQLAALSGGSGAAVKTIMSSKPTAGLSGSGSPSGGSLQNLPSMVGGC